MTNRDVRQIIAVMATITLAPLAVIQLAIMPVSMLEYTAICAPFVGCIGWFFKDKSDWI